MKGPRRAFLFLLLTSAWILLDSDSLAHGPNQYGVDIVQVDTGTAAVHTDHLSMVATTPFRWNLHGHEMALSLADQLVEERLFGVRAIQTVWVDNDADSIASGIYEGLRYEPKAISLSLTGDTFIESEALAVKYASDSGVLVLAASGNHHLATPEYPAIFSRKLSCVVAVGTIRGRVRASYSNVAEVYLQEVPGELGTSYSTARAAGVSLRYMSDHPKASCRQVKQWLVRKFGPARLGIK